MPRLSYALIVVATAILTLFFQQTPLRGDDAETFLLRYKFVKGQVVRYEDSLKDDYVIKAGPITEKQHSYKKSEKNYRVVSVNKDGSAELELTFEWVAIEILQNGVNAAYDSRLDKKLDPQLETFFGPMAEMVGKPRLRLTISSIGKISDLQPLINKQQKPNKLSINVLPELPKEPVKVGGLWTEDIAVPVSFPNNPQLKQMVKVQRRYFVRSLKDGIVDISVKTKVLTPLSDPELQMQLIRRQPQGDFQINLETGLFLSRKLTQENRVLNFAKGPSQMDFTQLHTEKMLPEIVAESRSASSTR